MQLVLENVLFGLFDLFNIWERPAETGHRARMIYFEKNGFPYSTRVFVRKKAFRNKNNGTVGKSRKKSIDIDAWFLFQRRSMRL